MLGISNENILDEGPLTEFCENDADRVVIIRYSRREPFLMRDGVNSVHIVPRENGQYLVEYRGFIAGSLKITRAGIEEIVDHLLADQPNVPYWAVTTIPDSLPEWLPAEYTSLDPVPCHHCGRDVPPTDMIALEKGINHICKDCWNEPRESVDK